MYLVEFENIWPVVAGDELRWSTYDRYYDITAEDDTVSPDTQSVTIDPITYTIKYSNATQGADEDDGDPLNDMPMNLDIQSNAYAYQVWGFGNNALVNPGHSEDMVLLRSSQGN